MKALNVSIIRGKVSYIKEDDATPAIRQKSAVYHVDSAPHHQLGCVKGIIHKVQVNSSKQSVCQKMRYLPLSICREVSGELNHLLRAGIIEHVDASEWVSPPSGGMETQLRLCVDLDEPNKNVIMDCYSLPHMGN